MKHLGTNEAYRRILMVDIGGVELEIFGSMSWTVAETKRLGWEVLRKAYVAITGDERDEVDPDEGMSVVAGELQKHWAEYTGRQDLLPAISEQQDKRIEYAIRSRQVEPPPPRAAVSREPKERNMGEKKEVPTKGASGLAAKLIQEGDTSKASVTAKVQEAFPAVKNVAPAVSYAARCVGVTLS
jgi:hypothetical protein